tara:strand:- start:2613 stop:3584 length:972 start_codon:yes stop_codon:yes gene_type:complete
MKKYLIIVITCLPLALFSQKENDKPSQAEVEEKLLEVFEDENFKEGFKDAIINVKLITEENYEELIKHNTKSIKKNKKNESAYTYRATGYYFLEQYDKALVDINKALKIKKSAGSYHIKANCHFALNQYDDVIEASQIIIKDFRDYKELALVIWGLGMAEFEKSIYKEAISNFKKYYIMTNDASGQSYIGYSHILLEEFEEGVKVLNSIKDEAVKDHMYYEYLGSGYKSLQNNEASKIAYLKANELSKGAHDYEVAQGYFNTQEYVKAAEYHTKYINTGNDDIHVSHYYRGVSYFQLDRYDEALADLRSMRLKILSIQKCNTI